MLFTSDDRHAAIEPPLALQTDGVWFHFATQRKDQCSDLASYNRHLTENNPINVQLLASLWPLATAFLHRTTGDNATREDETRRHDYAEYTTSDAIYHGFPPKTPKAQVKNLRESSSPQARAGLTRPVSGTGSTGSGDMTMPSNITMAEGHEKSTFMQT